MLNGNSKSIFFFLCGKISKKEKGIALWLGNSPAIELENMCTAIRFNERLFGRTLDYERSFSERLVVVPREKMPILESENRYAMMGVGTIFGNTPLYFDAVNEFGLAAAALNFPNYAEYSPAFSEGRGIASGHLVSHVLGLCRGVSEARQMLEKITITDEWVGGNRPTPLHWIFADGRESMVVEVCRGKIRLYDNPIGVLTNAPDFPYHMTRLADYSVISTQNPITTVGGSKLYSRGMGGIGLPGDFSSSSRFVRGAILKEWSFGRSSGDGISELSRAFSVISSTAIPRGAVISDEGLPVSTLYTAIIDLECPTYYLTTASCRAILRADLNNSLCDGKEIQSFSIYRDESILSLIED